jgi:protein-tyrosine phosphatase
MSEVERERLIQLQGALNFRDLGGYAGDGGRMVRWGRVFRSDALHELTEEDLRVIKELGLRVVYDLRRPVERERQPTAIPDDQGHRVVHLVIGEDPDATNQRETLDLILSGELVEADDQFMVDLYVKMLDAGAPAFGQLLTGLTDDGALPALFHCAAGKDRTGIAAALLLLVLGVERETVLDDYELSTVYRSNARIEALRPQLEGAGVDVEKVRPFLSARRPVLAGALDYIDRAHDGVVPYLTGPAGMHAAALDRLRSLLLERK